MSSWAAAECVVDDSSTIGSELDALSIQVEEVGKMDIRDRVDRIQEQSSMASVGRLLVLGQDIHKLHMGTVVVIETQWAALEDWMALRRCPRS